MTNDSKRLAILCTEVEGISGLADSDPEPWAAVVTRERRRAAGTWEYWARRSDIQPSLYPWLVTINDTTYAVSGDTRPTDPGLHAHPWRRVATTAAA